MQLFPPNNSTTPTVTGVTAANGLTLTAGTLAFSAMTTAGDTIYGGTTGASTRLPIGSAAQVLTVNGGATAPAWAAAPGANIVDAYLTGQTGAITICTTTPAADGTYRVGGFLTITAISVDVLNLQIAWKDETNTSRTISLFANGLSTVSLAATGVYLFSPVDIRAKSGNAITLQVVLTTSAGSVSYDTGGSIQFVRA